MKELFFFLSNRGRDEQKLELDYIDFFLCFLFLFFFFFSFLSLCGELQFGDFGGNYYYFFLSFGLFYIGRMKFSVAFFSYSYFSSPLCIVTLNN